MLSVIDDNIEVVVGNRMIALEKKKLIKLQALWRGTLLRKQLREVQESYQALVESLEDERLNTMVLSWRGTVPRPQFTSKDYQTAASVENRKPSKVCSRQATKTLDLQRDQKRECTVNNRDNSTESYSTNRGTNTDCVNTDNNVSLSKGTDKNSESSKPSCGEEIQGDSNLRVDKQLSARIDSSTDQPERDHHYQIEGTGSQLRECRVSSVWDSVMTETPNVKQDNISTSDLDRVALEKERANLAMELLWVQQAIDSRKQYLHLKSNVTDGGTD